MPTPGEKKALLFFGAIALLGVGARVEQSRRPPPQATPEQRAALKRHIAKVDSVAKAGGRKPRKVRGDTTGSAALRQIVDLDRASVEAIESLPRIGPALAARIVANRDTFGPFGSLAGLDRVKGVGPAMTKQLAPYVSFSRSAEVRPPPPARRPRQ